MSSVLMTEQHSWQDSLVGSVLAAKTDNLSSIPDTHMTGESPYTCFPVASPGTVRHAFTYVHKYTYTKNK